MNRILSALLLLCFSVFLSDSLSAQNKELSAITEDICDCLEGKDLDRLSEDESFTVFEECMGIGMLTNLGKLEKAYGKDFLDDDAALEQFGEEVVFDMLATCPLVASQVLAVAANSDEFEIYCPSQDISVLEGTVTASGVDGVAFIRVISEGVSYDLVIHSYFDGASDLIRKDIAGSKVAVKVIENRVYNPELGAFEERWEIVGINE
jgi:hypothetical protein